MAEEDRKTRAEARLESALTQSGLEDPRPAYRERLRSLRETSTSAFEQALRHYEEQTLVALAGDADPIEAWVEYGRVLGELTAPGRLLQVDTLGRASTYAPPAASDLLVLHVPEDSAAPILAAAVPRAASAAQRAAYALLVERRLSL
jgi:hypothetical protein